MVVLCERRVLEREEPFDAFQCDGPTFFDQVVKYTADFLRETGRVMTKVRRDQRLQSFLRRLVDSGKAFVAINPPIRVVLFNK